MTYDNFQILDSLPLARPYLCNSYTIGATYNYLPFFLWGCHLWMVSKAAAVALSHSLFFCSCVTFTASVMQMEPISTSERGKERERISNYGLLSNLHPHSRSLSLSVCHLQIPSLGGADCTSAVGNVGRYLHHVEEEDKRKKEGQFCVSPSPSRRHLDLVPPLSFTFTFIVSSRAKGTTEVASKMLSKFSWFRHDE